MGNGFRICHSNGGGVFSEFLGSNLHLILELLFAHHPPLQCKAGARRGAPLCEVLYDTFNIKSINNAVTALFMDVILRE
jgi:hypothetical protein